MLIPITLAVFASTALSTGALVYHYANKHHAIKKRVADLAQQQAEKTELIPVRGKGETLLARVGGRLSTKAGDLRSYQAAITAAGFRKESVYVYLGAKAFLAAALPVGYLLLYALPHGSAGRSTTTLALFVLATAGYLLPTMWLDRRASNRKTAIFHSLPDVLDLLTVCVDAGLGLDAALTKTVDHFQDQNNPLIKEIKTVTLEVRAGRPRVEALRALAERTKVEDLNSFVSMMIQTEKFGTSLTRTMRSYADGLRMKRKQLAEEQAAKTGVKMLFPLTFFVFPALLVVMLVPAFHRISFIFHK